MGHFDLPHNNFLPLHREHILDLNAIISHIPQAYYIFNYNSITFPT